MATNQATGSKDSNGRPTDGSVVFTDGTGRSRRFSSLSQLGKFLIATSVLIKSHI